MAISNKPQQVGLSDPNLIRQTESKLAQSALIAKGKPTVIGDTVVLPSTTVQATPTSVTTTTSANNQVADTTTVYQTNGTVYVSSIDQTIQQVTNKNIVNQIGVTQINEGNNITIVSSDGNGAGIVTINAVLPAYGNIAVINLDGNASNVLHGNGSWSADLTTYSNSNVVSLMAAFGSNTIVTTGNANVGNLISTGVVKVSGASAYFDAGVGYMQNGGTGEFQLSTANATQPLKISTNSASKNWFFYANGNMTAPGAVSVTGNITAGNVIGPHANGNSNVNIATANGNITLTAVSNTTMTISGTGANITGTANISGNANVGNIGANNGVFTGNISGNTAGFAIGYLNIPQVAASNTTIALTDAGKHYYSTSAGNFTLTVPNNTTTSFATGTAISIVVQSAGNVLVNAASGVTLYMAGNSTAANRVVSNYGMATIMKVATDTWMINGTGVA